MIFIYSTWFKDFCHCPPYHFEGRVLFDPDVVSKSLGTLPNNFAFTVEKTVLSTQDNGWLVYIRHGLGNSAIVRHSISKAAPFSKSPLVYINEYFLSQLQYYKQYCLKNLSKKKTFYNYKQNRKTFRSLATVRSV